MRTLASELGSHIGHLSDTPRVYADANVPAGLVTFMRTRLRWDVLFVMDHPDLRRASDSEHFRLASRLCRTLVTLDHDYFDDRRFPPLESPGVIVLSAPDERILARVITRVDRAYFRSARGDAVEEGHGLPLRGRKIHAHPGWTAAPESPGRE
jgi:predicted nuclease of predicted toxin-antitoxin system